MKNVFLSFLFSIITLLALAQSPPIEWQKSLGGTGGEIAKGVQQASDGGYIVGGSSTSTNGQVTGNHGGTDCWVVKLNSDGTVAWQKSLGGSGEDILNSIRLTSDGGYILSGSTSSNNGDVSGNHGSNNDGWVVKLSSTGNVEWQKCYGGTGVDVLYYVEQTSDGGYVGVGASPGGDGNTAGATTNGGGWVLKFNSTGVIQWQNSYGDGFPLRCISQASDGGYIAGGRTDGPGKTYKVLKLSSTGATEWLNNLSYSSDIFQPTAIKQTTDGGYIFTGTSSSLKLLVVKLNSTGDPVWAKFLGGDLTELAGNIILTSDGGYLATGTAYSDVGDVSGNHEEGTGDCWVVKLNSAGTVQWQKPLGGLGTDEGYWGEATSDGGYIIAGKGISNTGDITGNHGGDDFWVVKLAGTLPSSFAISSSAGPNGIITPGGTTNVNTGNNQVYTITPDANYHIANVLVDGVSNTAATGSGTYTFTNVIATHSISATFGINTFAMTASAGANGTITPSGVTQAGYNSSQVYTISPNANYHIVNVLVDGVSNPGAISSGTYTFTNVTAPHSISATFAINAFAISSSAGANGTISPNGITSVNYGGSQVYSIASNSGYNVLEVLVDGVSVGQGTSYTFSNVTAAHTIQANFTLGCVPGTWTGSINNDWDNAGNWSCNTLPSSGTSIIISSGTPHLNQDFTVAGSLIISGSGSLVVDPTYTLTITGNADFGGKSVTFSSTNAGYASLGQVTGTLSNATNVIVERYLPNNGFRSWRLLSVPTFGSGQTIRQAWQEGEANPMPKQNNIANYGTQITGVFTTQAAAAAAGFDSTSVQAGMLSWNGTGWANVTGTNQSIANNKSWFLYVRGDRSQTVTGSSGNSSATTLRTKGTLYTGNQVTGVDANAFALVPNVYPSAINFTGLTRTGGVSNLFYIWDSKKLSGNSLGYYQTFSQTNGFNCLVGGGSYVLGQPNTTIESGQSFFVTSAAAGTITLRESAKISGTNGSLGFRPAAQSKIDTRLYNSAGEMLDANTVVFDAGYDKEVAGEDAPKMGNPGANFAIETGGKLLAVEGTQPVKENDAIQFRVWNISAGTYSLEIEAQRLSLPEGVTAILEDSYLKTSTAINLAAANKTAFTVNQDARSSSANRFKIMFVKAKPVATNSKPSYTIAPNPVENGTVNLQLNNQPAGKYAVRIVGAGGQAVWSGTISHAGGTAAQSISLPAGLAAGTHTVEIVAPGKTRSTQTVLVVRK